MMNWLNILWMLFNLVGIIFLVIVAKRINAKKFKVEVLDTKVKAIQKRISNEQQELEELKRTLEEQKTVLNQKWDQIQEASRLLDARALKLDEERQWLASQQEEVTSKKIEIEQQEVKLEQTVQQLKEKWQQHRNEIKAEREQLVKEFERINEAIRYLEGLENKIKIETQKADKERSYLTEQFKALELSRRELEQKEQLLKEKEHQLHEIAKQQLEAKANLERERELMKQQLEQQALFSNVQPRAKSETQRTEIPKADPQKPRVLPSPRHIQVTLAKDMLDKNIADRWQWVGNLLRDDGQPGELLFGKTLPRVIDQQRWADVDGIVIGEHDNGTDQLLWQFKPDKIGPELDLNALEQQQKINIFAQSHNTQFFLAAYDKDQRLIGFQTFRFMPQLQDIEIEPIRLLPGPEGHQPIHLRFIHDPGCRVRPQDNPNNAIAIRSEENHTTAIIPPHPVLDATTWEIVDSVGRKLEISIHLHRIWWSLANDPQLSSQASPISQPVEIPWEAIHSGAVKGIQIWLPRHHGLQQIYIGLTKQKRKAFQLKPDDQQIFVSLDGWIDPNELARSPERLSIQLWLDKRTHESTELAFIAPAPLICKAPNCQFKAFEKSAMLDHVKEQHFDLFFRQADYHAIRQHIDPTLPAQIYQCGYCHRYFRAEANETNSMDVIIHHVLQCPDANRPGETPLIKFRIITDCNEIRQNVIPDLPQFFQCSLCQQLFEPHDPNEMFTHLLSAHESAVIELDNRAANSSKKVFSEQDIIRP